MAAIYILTTVLVVLSFLADRKKTWRGLRIGVKRFLKIAPAFLSMLLLVSVVLSFTPDQFLADVLARDSKWIAMVAGLSLGSVSVMPGFIAFPLCGILLEKGALYMVLSAFSTTLMMIGIATFPLEKAYLGTRLALARNAVSFFVALAVAIATGLVYGELL